MPKGKRAMCQKALKQIEVGFLQEKQQRGRPPDAEAFLLRMRSRICGTAMNNNSILVSRWYVLGGYQN